MDPKPDDLFIDATVGAGGHTFELIKRGARVLGIDRDPEAIKYLEEKIRNPKSEIRNLVLILGNFSDIGRVAKENGFGRVEGIIFDLGVSSDQLENAARGFSFSREGPLDMRMDSTLAVRASDIINNFDQRRLDEIFKTYGGEKHSWRIAGAICRARKIKAIETTLELAEIVKGATFEVKSRIHPATKVFQALRIVVNSELLNLEQALPQTVELLKSGGRLAIISFHSLEDGIVKRFFNNESKLKVLTKKPIGPSLREISANVRSRSAKLRVAVKI